MYLTVETFKNASDCSQNLSETTFILIYSKHPAIVLESGDRLTLIDIYL